MTAEWAIKGPYTFCSVDEKKGIHDAIGLKIWGHFQLYSTKKYALRWLHHSDILELPAPWVEDQRGQGQGTSDGSREVSAIKLLPAAMATLCS